jgi:nitrate/nitrite-specific signal transduction histidine kinase
MQIFLARLAKVFVHSPRLVCTAHSNNEGGALRMFAYRITDVLADVFTNVSQNAVAVFEKRRPHRLVQ